MGVPKFPHLGLPRLWGRITSCADLWLQWGFKKSCSPCQELSNGMSHISWMQRNWVNSWLLMVGSQIGNLTLDLSFGHNLCYRCSNGQCEPILDIYTSIAFKWHKELFKAMSSDPWNCAMKIRESIRDSNSQHGSSLGSVRVHALTLFALLGVCDVTIGSLSWPAPLQPLALVASPRLGLRQYTYVELLQFPNNFFSFLINF